MANGIGPLTKEAVFGFIDQVKNAEYEILPGYQLVNSGGRVLCEVQARRVSKRGQVSLKVDPSIDANDWYLQSPDGSKHRLFDGPDGPFVESSSE